MVRLSSAARRVRTIAKKELVEFVRDWRTIVAILVIPLLMFPILFILFPILLASEAAELDAVVVDLVIQSDDVPDELIGLLENASLNPTYEPLPAVVELSEPNEDQERLRNGSVDAILRLRTNGTVLEYAVLYLSTSEQSLEARSRAFDALGSWEETKRCGALMLQGWTPTRPWIHCVGAVTVAKAMRRLKVSKQVWRCRCSSPSSLPSGPFPLPSNPPST